MYGLDVLQCIVHGGFGLYFVGFVVLGGVLSTRLVWAWRWRPW